MPMSIGEPSPVGINATNVGDTGSQKKTAVSRAAATSSCSDPPRLASNASYAGSREPNRLATRRYTPQTKRSDWGRHTVGESRRQARDSAECQATTDRVPSLHAGSCGQGSIADKQSRQRYCHVWKSRIPEQYGRL